MKRSEVIVCAGGGGVGKTTTSAALALTLARSGQRALIVSIDPARRLADAMGVELGTEAREIELEGERGRLFALMPDPHDALRTFIEMLFAEEPGSIERLLHNRLYLALESAVPGIHEVVAMSLTWRAIVDHDIDVVIIDTAPSRNAVDFIGYPRRLAKLLGGRAVGWIAAIGKRTSFAPGDEMGRVEGMLVRALGPVVRDVAGLFSEMSRVRERFITLNRHTSELLLQRDTRYLLVAAPTAAARDDVDYLFSKLGSLEIRPRAIIINSSFTPSREWVGVLRDSDGISEAVLNVLDTLDQEAAIREAASRRTRETFSQLYPGMPLIELPFLELIEPREIVQTLAGCFDSESLLEG